MSEWVAPAKQRLSCMLAELGRESEREIAAVLDRYCDADCIWHLYHPFGRLSGDAAATEHFWKPLRGAFPDYEFRPGHMLAGEYEGRIHASMLGHFMGNLEAPWLGIPETHQLSFRNTSRGRGDSRPCWPFLRDRGRSPGDDSGLARHEGNSYGRPVAGACPDWKKNRDAGGGLVPSQHPRRDRR